MCLQCVYVGINQQKNVKILLDDVQNIIFSSFFCPENNAATEHTEESLTSYHKHTQCDLKNKNVFFFYLASIKIARHNIFLPTQFTNVNSTEFFTHSIESIFILSYLVFKQFIFLPYFFFFIILVFQNYFQIR